VASWAADSVDLSDSEVAGGGDVGGIHSNFDSGELHPNKRVVINPKYEKLRLTQERLPCSN